MDLGAFIKTRKDELGLTDTDIATAVGISRSNVSRWQTGGITKIAHRHIKPLAEILRCDPMVFLSDNVVEDSFAEDTGAEDTMHVGTQRVPMLGNIAAGMPIYADGNFDSYVQTGANIRCDFCLRVKGDSMILARIHDGDIVFVRKQPDVNNGEIAVVFIGDEATLKRVYKYENRLELRPENPAFPVLNFEGPELEQVRILGKAVAFHADVK